MSGYSFLNCGTCLGDVVPDGSMLEVDAALDVEIGDIVAVVIKADGPFAGLGRRFAGVGLLGVTKIFLGVEQSYSGEKLLLFGQLDPPLVMPVPEGALHAMHLVVGGKAVSDAEAISEASSAAMELLAPFFRNCAPQPPIGSRWRPQEA